MKTSGTLKTRLGRLIMNALGIEEGGATTAPKPAPFVGPAIENAMKDLSRRKLARGRIAHRVSEVNMGNGWIAVTKEEAERIWFDKLVAEAESLGLKTSPTMLPTNTYIDLLKRFIKNTREEETMAMSKDRVRFSIPVNRLLRSEAGCSANKYFEVVCSTLGMSFNQLNKALDNSQCSPRHMEWADRIHFICRPSQFARFVIARNDAGLCNAFKEIQPELFTPEDHEKIRPIDVSGNSA